MFPPSVITIVTCPSTGPKIPRYFSLGRSISRPLGREPRERPFVLIPLGYPADDCVVPEEAFKRRPLERTLIVDRG